LRIHPWFQNNPGSSAILPAEEDIGHHSQSQRKLKTAMNIVLGFIIFITFIVLILLIVYLAK
jgi:hypothetical protein